MKNSEFVRIYKMGRSANAKHFFLKILENKLEHPRFSVVVSKKVSKLAVRRNSDRRRLAEAAKKNLEGWKNVDVIIYLKSTLKGVPFGEIEKELKEVLKKAGVT